MIAANKQDVKRFVEGVLSCYKSSSAYAIVSGLESAKNDFINAKLYELYKDNERSSSMHTQQLLKEVLDEYDGFSNYFIKREEEARKQNANLQKHMYAGASETRKFWGMGG